MKQQYSFTDEDLRVAAASVCASMLDAVEAIPSGEHEFSASFLDKMNALLSLDRLRRKRRQLWHRVASVFLAFLLGASIFLATNPEARATFLAWVREVYENSVVYRFFGSPTKIFPQYELKWIPEGIVQVSEIDGERSEGNQKTIVCSNNETGEGFVFSYQAISDDVLMTVDGYANEEMRASEPCIINGIEGQYYSGNNLHSSCLIWIDEEQGVVFFIDSNLEKSVILHIAEGVTLANLTN